MQIDLIVVGKTDMREVESLVAMYAKRINRYCKFSVTTIADVRNTRNMAASRQKQLEGEMILKNFDAAASGACTSRKSVERFSFAPPRSAASEMPHTR